MIANAGLLRVVFGEFYRDARIFEFAKQLGIELVKVETPRAAASERDLSGDRREV